MMNKRLRFLAVILASSMLFSSFSFASSPEMPAEENVQESESESQKESETAKEPEGTRETETPAEAKPSKTYKEKWIKKGGKIYWRQADGTILKKKGAVKLKGSYYYLNKDYSRFSSGFRKTGGKYYYYQSSGKRYTKRGFTKIDGKIYYFCSNKALYVKKGFSTTKGKTYYFHKKHYALTGMQKISGKVYFFDEDGVLLKNKSSYEYGDKYYRIDSEGVASELSGNEIVAGRLTWIFINKYSSENESSAARFRKCFNRLMWADYRPSYISRSEVLSEGGVYDVAVKVFRNTDTWTQNCYGFACAVASCAKELGYEPYVCVLDDDHAVVRIDGKYYDNMGGGRFGASSYYLSSARIAREIKF